MDYYEWLENEFDENINDSDLITKKNYSEIIKENDYNEIIKENKENKDFQDQKEIKKKIYKRKKNNIIIV